MHTLTNQLFQTFLNADETLRVEVLYNNSKDYFYFNVFENDVLAQGDRAILREYSDKYVSFFSLEEKATFEAVTTFKMEFKK